MSCNNTTEVSGCRGERGSGFVFLGFFFVLKANLLKESDYWLLLLGLSFNHST